MTFNNKKIAYRVTLNTEEDIFVVYARDDETKIATGDTIQEAVSKLHQII